MASTAEKKNKAKKAQTKKQKDHVKKVILPKLIALATSSTPNAQMTLKPEEVTLFEKEDKTETWFIDKASHVTNSSWNGEVLFLDPKKSANIPTYSRNWNMLALNTYGDWVRKDWRTVFSYEVLNHLGFDLETINKAKKDYHFVRDQLDKKDRWWMTAAEKTADDTDRPVLAMEESL